MLHHATACSPPVVLAFILSPIHARRHGSCRTSKTRARQRYDKLQKADGLHTITRAEIVELFGILDQTNSGEITREDLLILSSIPGSKFTEAHVNHIMEDCLRRVV